MIPSRTLKTRIHIIGWLLLVLYSTFYLFWILTGCLLWVRLFLLLGLTVGILGLIWRQEWGRQTFMASAVLGALYMGFGLLFWRPFDMMSWGFVLTCLLSIVFYQTPVVKKYYVTKNQQTPWTVLVIDDDKTLLKMVVRYFLPRGVFVLTAETGEKGLALAKSWQPDLILLDVILPKIKGREVCTQLKEDAATRDIPVIFLTVKSSMDDVLAEMEAGAIAHITKPVDFAHLYEEVIKVLGD